MRPFRRNLLVFGCGVVALAACSAPAPACGQYHLTADAPVTLEGDVRLMLPPGAAAVTFDSLALAEADLLADANADAAAAVNAMPVNLQPEGSVLAFHRCADAAAPVRLELPAPDATLDAYAWDGEQWTWLGGSADTLVADLPDLPQYVAWVRALPTAPIIGTQPHPQTAGLAPEYHGIITELYAPGLTVNPNGTVSGLVPTAPAPSAGYGVYAVIRNVKKDGTVDTESVTAMLSDEAARQTHTAALAALANESNLAGIVLDYVVEPESRDAYAALAEELAAALRPNGKQLILHLPGESAQPASDEQSGYDWARLGRAADVLQIDPAIAEWAATKVDRHKLQPVVSAGSAEVGDEGESPLSFAEAVAGLPVTQTVTLSGTAGTPIRFSVNPSATLIFKATDGHYEYASSDPGSPDRIHLRTAATLAKRLNDLADLGLRGAVISQAQGPDVAPNLLEPIRAYRQQSAITGSSDLLVNWTIAAADGITAATETLPLADADLTWTPASDGTYTVTATIDPVSRAIAVVTVGRRAAGTAIGGAGTAGAPSDGRCVNAVYVADVTVPDNTRFDRNKDFTKTWKVRNNGTCAWGADTQLFFVRGSQLGAPAAVQVEAAGPGQTVEVSVPMNSGGKDGNFIGMWQLRDEDGAFGGPLSVVIAVGNPVAAAPTPVVPPAGGGRTEYGIHAHYYGYIDAAEGAQGIAGYTNELGLGWTKIQFRWGDYDYYCGGPDLNRLGTMIDTANAAGLKVMLSVVTAPPCTHPWTADVHAPPDDPAAYAELVGGLADLFKGRIHAIEVWNEQNISREWVTSPQTLDAARYTQLLAAAYNAIKSKDPAILVVSGALAPTGWNDGVNATDDFEYLKQMVASGAAKYMDCVGTHVNALRVPPSAALGGEYDSLFSPPHHSWYFSNTVQGYQSITGKPACVTEFGVASTETIGSVAGFEWAADNSQQEQADWVTEGMSLCRQWGCRLVILWNLDYGPATHLVNDNALYSFIDMGLGRRPVFHAVKDWCAANGCR